MIRLTVTLAVLILSWGAREPVRAATRAAAPDTIRYELSWENPASQLYTVRTTAAASGQPLQFSLPAWRPGRYILQNYASNVQAVRARDERGDSLPVTWVDLDSWKVEPGRAKRVTLAYEFYARTFDAGSSTLRPDVAYFNPVNLFPWVEGRKGEPVRLTLDAPADWTVATQLEPAPGPGHAFTAPDYDAFVDAPTIAAPDLTEWEFTLDGVPYHVVFRGELDLGDYSKERVVHDLEAIAREETAMFGGPPYDRYWFLYQLVGYPFGHAVEHTASSSYVLTDVLFQSEEYYHQFLSVTAHELFHAWNVKRIRPAALWPYDYSTPQLTHLHWVTEGVTSYYENMVLERAGVIEPAELYRNIGRAITQLQSTPGRLVTPLSIASWTSWHSGYGAENPNQSVSFYLKGALVGLALDLTIRDATDGARSLDDVMRVLWREYYLQGRGYPEDGVQKAAEEVAGRPLGDFFAKYVDGTAEIPFDSLLGVVGSTARQVEDPDEPAARLGVGLDEKDGAVVVRAVVSGGAALAGGMMAGDRLVAIDGDSLASTDLDPILKEHAPGAAVTLTLEREGRTIERQVTLGGGGNLSWKVEPVAEPTERQERLRADWLASSDVPTPCCAAPAP